MVALDGQINARVVDQVWNQDIFQRIQIVFEVVMQISQQSFPFLSKRFIA